MTPLELSPVDISVRDQDLAADHLAIAPAVADLLFAQAYTANAFTDEAISDEQLRAVYDLVKWGPTALNSQPMRVVLVRSPEARDRLVPLMTGHNQARTAGAPLVAILAADVDWHDELHRVMPPFAGAHATFDADRAGRRETALQSAWMQAGYFVVGVRAAGLDAGPMGGFDTEAVSREFFPDGAHEAFLVVNLGHADVSGNRPRQPRLDYDEVVTTV